MASIIAGIEKRVKEIQQALGLTDTEVQYLMKHQQVKHAQLAVNGKKYDAWRIIHNRALGPGKGGIRFHPGVNKDEVKALSFWMSMKNSLAGLPYGGAKGGVAINPKEETPEQIEAVSRAYIRAFAEVVGQDKDIPAPDVYTNPQIMGWMVDEFEKTVGRHEPGMITGKPLELGGIPLRGAATARGGQIITHKLLEQWGGKAAEMTVAVQGYGNAGAHIAEMLEADGFKLVAVSDSKGGIRSSDCLHTRELNEVKEATGSVMNLEGGTQCSNEELLEMEVDILVLAALENQVTKENADKIKAKYILELANGPVTPEADALLFKKGIHVVPDILANAGGVVVSYFEWVQNKVGNIFDEDFLEKKLVQIMSHSWDAVQHVYERHNKEYDLRSCAYILAIERIMKAEKARGNI